MSETKQMYLCYDLKGIQSFIFAVPKLRYICGGSALVDLFDKTLKNDAPPSGCRYLFSGGGKGAFTCESLDAADALQEKLVDRAHADGLTICFGRDTNYSTAANRATRSFPWMPDGDELKGRPCPASGLYPVQTGQPHPHISGRVWQQGDRLDRHFEEELLKGLTAGEYGPGELEFFHEIGSDTPVARAATAAMGNRNRWAVIAMDGNDMGNQHRAAVDVYKDQSTEAYTKWLSKMSQELDACTRRACHDGIASVIEAWEQDGNSCDHILPFRPLVVGGDDIIVLCHAEYALKFMESVSTSFTERSKEANQRWQDSHSSLLWLGTNGELTISGGVLYSPISLPLSTAIEYAESLLKSAKGLGRTLAEAGEATPACFDWESVTEGVIDTPAARRQRELIFIDGDLDGERVELSNRPYRIGDLPTMINGMDELSNVPPTIRHQILPEMRKPFWERRAYVERLRKHQKALADRLTEGDTPHSKPKGDWAQQENTRTLPTIDLLLLMEEHHRMSKQTASSSKGVQA